MATRTRVIVYAGLAAAAYVVATIALAPFSYGPVQFRVSELLKPLALVHPLFAVSFLVGNGLANLGSPFGAWDFVAMPFVDCGAALLCWSLRRVPVVGLVVQAVVISAGVAVFPLHMGGGIPVWPTVAWVLFSELILLLVGYFIIWRKHGTDLLRGW
jgi:uncharacterized membrane protein